MPRRRTSAPSPTAQPRCARSPSSTARGRARCATRSATGGSSRPTSSPTTFPSRTCPDDGSAMSATSPCRYPTATALAGSTASCSAGSSSPVTSPARSTSRRSRRRRGSTGCKPNLTSDCSSGSTTSPRRSNACGRSAARCWPSRTTSRVATPSAATTKGFVSTCSAPDPVTSLRPVMGKLRERQEWKFFGVLPKADRTLAALWWTVLVLRGVLPAMFAIAMGGVIGAVQNVYALGGPLAFAGVVFVLMQVMKPIHTAVSANLGDRTAAWLYDRLTDACVQPQGMGHLEDPSLTADLTVAREFDAGMTGPPLYLSMDFIADGLAQMMGGLASAVVLFGFAWWAPIVLAGGWLATHYLLRESAVWRDRNTDDVRAAQRDSEYAYRISVDPPAAKELRLFGLKDWTIDRFIDRRTT